MSAIDFASAFGTYIESGTVVLGRDTRRTGERLRSAVIAGLLSTGIDIYDVGIVPTPVLQHALVQSGANGGLCISGPSVGTEWKALKFFGADGAPLNSYQDEELLDIFHNGSFSQAPWNQLGHLVYEKSALQKYAEALKTFLDIETIRERQFKIVIDCCNGTASQFVDLLFTELGCDVIAINNEPSPDAVYTPLLEAKNTQAICQIVNPVGADAGFYVNIDASSLIVISDQGVSLGEEYTFALLADYVLSKNSGRAVVTNVSTSQLIDDIAQKYGSTVSRCQIGQKYIIERMRSMSAVIGGEGSGGIAFPEFLYGFDGIASIGIMLQMLAQRQINISDLIREFPQYTIKKDVVRCPVYLFHAILRRIAEIFARERLDLTDGVKIFFDSGWLHIRPSRNEPIIRVIAESLNPDEAENLLQRGKTEVRKAML
jgi:phosphomannomutase